jgi:hypothetical protein
VADLVVFTGWSAPHRRSTNWLLLDGRVENVRYLGTFYPLGAPFFAINQPNRYALPVHTTTSGTPAPTSSQYLWSREQMAAAQ